MSLNWSWNDKMGDMTIVQEHPGDEPREFNINIYKGNAYMIFLNEYKEDGEDMYNLYNFFVDKEHFKNCLGLTKGYKRNILEDWGIKKMRLNLKYKDVPDIIKMFAQSGLAIEIELYKED